MTVIHGGNREKIAALIQRPATSLLDFSANINPLGVPQALKATLSAALTELSDYPNPEYPRLKSAIAKHHQVAATDIVVGNGAVQLIFDAALALHVQTALVLAPCFGEYERALKKAGTQVTHFSLTRDDDFQLTGAQLIQALKDQPQVKLVCLGNPNNPTGTMLNDADLDQLVSYCRQQKIWVILDEAFMDLSLSPNEGWLPKLRPSDPVIIIRSLTKFFAIPGLRLGYAITKHKALQQKMRDQSEPWSVNTVAARFGERAFDDRTYIQATQNWLQTEQPWLGQQLQGITFLHVFPSVTNYFLVYSSVPHLREKLWQVGILIRDCRDYVELDAGYYRMAVKSHEANQELVQQLRVLE